jgi:AraC-like DNA-binding protein
MEPLNRYSNLLVSLLDRLEDAALLIDTQGCFIYGNPSACKFLDCSGADLLAMTVQALPLVNFAQVWSARSSPELCFTDRHATALDSELMVEITMIQEQNSDLSFSCLLIHPVATAVDQAARPQEESVLPSVPQLEEVFRFIEENHARSISLRDVATAMGYCPSYLTDLVRRCTGQTVNHWIIKRRIALACHLLRDTDRSVNQIAIATGYQNEGHFFRQFRQHCGTTPSIWRKSQQSGGTP